MPSPESLEQAYAGASGTAPASATTLGPELVRRYVSAAARYPALQVDAEDFAAHVGRATAGSREALEDARTDELFLALACARGDSAALAVLEGELIPAVRGALRRMRLDDDAAAEILQQLRDSLLVARDGAPPRILSFSGRGDLGGWLRVTATRLALRSLRGGRDVELDERGALEHGSAQADPELAYLRESYRRPLSQSFADALASLTPKERVMLKQQVVDGLTIDDLARLHGVHRATCARWAQHAREKLLTRTRRLFMLRARLTSDECASVFRMVRSQLDLSVHRHLAAIEGSVPR